MNSWALEQEPATLQSWPDMVPAGGPMQTQVAPLNSIVTPGHIYLLSCKLCFTCSISSVISITRYLMYIIVHTNTSVCSSSFSAHFISMCGADPMTATPEKSPHVGNHKINCCGGLTRNKMTCNRKDAPNNLNRMWGARAHLLRPHLGGTICDWDASRRHHGDIHFWTAKESFTSGAPSFESELTKCKSSKEMCTVQFLGLTSTLWPLRNHSLTNLVLKSSKIKRLSIFWTWKGCNPKCPCLLAICWLFNG